MQRVAVYVDGFNLYFGLKEARWRRYYWLDVHALALRLLKADQTLSSVRYYTTRISGPPDKRDRQADYLDALATLPMLRIAYGHYLTKKRRCSSCGATNEVPEEKMTDVNIAVDMLTDAFADRFDTAIVISADSDLSPPIEAIRQRWPQKRVVVAFPPRRASKRLKSEASAWFPLGRKVIADSQFPDQVVRADGFVIRRPPRWR
jgi:uncharacterized LabA/DUF88 family protein